MYSHIYDFPVWKHLCSINEFMESKVERTQSVLQCLPDANGQFSLKSAYTIIAASGCRFDESR